MCARYYYWTTRDFGTINKPLQTVFFRSKKREKNNRNTPNGVFFRFKISMEEVDDSCGDYLHFHPMTKDAEAHAESGGVEVSAVLEDVWQRAAYADGVIRTDAHVSQSIFL